MGEMKHISTLYSPMNSPKKASVLAILTEAWHLVKGLKWLVFKRALLIFALIAAFMTLEVVLIKFVYEPLALPPLLTHMINYVVKFFLIMLCVQLWAPVLIMGVRQAIGLAIDLQKIKAECSQVKYNLFILSASYAAISILIVIIFTVLPADDTYLGLFRALRQIIILLVLAPISFFAFPLVVTQKTNPKLALISAYQTMQKNLMIILGTSILLSIMLFACFWAFYLITQMLPVIKTYFYIPFLLTLLLWLLPMIATLGGVLFRETYGLKKIK